VNGQAPRLIEFWKQHGGACWEDEATKKVA
jgi:hypothetical protein